MALVKLTTKQVATLVNYATKKYLGETAVLQEDLKKVIDMGVAIQNAVLNNGVFNLYVKPSGTSSYTKVTGATLVSDEITPV